MLKKSLVAASLFSASSSAFCVGFAEGTLIRVSSDRGEQAIPIEEVKVNDEILSCDGTKCVVGRVSELIEDFQYTVQITTELNEVIVAAEDQKFFVDSSSQEYDKCWKLARQLKIGDLLETPEGHVRIEAVVPGDQEPLYTFEVADHHTFYAYDTLVHNPYGLGNGPYGQAQSVAHNAGEISDSTKAAVACYGEAAARGCYQGAAAGKLAGAKGIVAHAVNCATNALVEVGETLLMGDCNKAHGATPGAFTGPQYDFNQSTFDATGRLEGCDHNGCSTVEAANNEANGINADNYGLVESVGNNTATSPAE